MKTRKIIHLPEGERPEPKKMPWVKSRPGCPRCNGGGSIPTDKSTQTERDRVYKKGLTTFATHLPCPECNPNSEDRSPRS